MARRFCGIIGSIIIYKKLMKIAIKFLNNCNNWLGS